MIRVLLFKNGLGQIMKRKKYTYIFLLFLLMKIVAILGCNKLEDFEYPTVVPPIITKRTSVKNLTATQSFDGGLPLFWDMPIATSLKELKITAIPNDSALNEIERTIPRGTLYVMPYKLYGIKAGKEYSISVKTIGNDDTILGTETLTEILSEDSEPPHSSVVLPDLELEIDNNSGQVMVTWNRDEVLAMGLDIEKISVKIDPVSEEAETLVSLGSISITTGALTSNTVYELQVKLIDINGNKQADATPVNTLKFTPGAEAPDNIQLTIETEDWNGDPADRALLISWPNIDMNGDGTVIEVKIKDKTTNRIIVNERIPDSSSDTFLSTGGNINIFIKKTALALTKLYGEKDYVIYARVFKNAQYSNRFTETITVHDTYIEAVESIELVGTDKSILVAWKPPMIPNSDSLDQTTNVTVPLPDYRGAELTLLNKDQVVESIALLEDLTNHVFLGLFPDTLYTVRIASIDFTGNKATAVESAVNTLTESDTEGPAWTIDSAEIEINHRLISDDDALVIISWTAPEEHLNRYEIHIIEDNTQTVLHSAEVGSQKTEYEVQFTNILIPGESYTVTIEVFDISENSTELSKIFSVPNIPVPLWADVFNASATGNPDSYLDFDEDEFTITFTFLENQDKNDGNTYTLQIREGSNTITKSHTYSSTGNTGQALSFGFSDALKPGTMYGYSFRVKNRSGNKSAFGVEKEFTTDILDLSSFLKRYKIDLIYEDVETTLNTVFTIAPEWIPDIGAEDGDLVYSMKRWDNNSDEAGISINEATGIITVNRSTKLSETLFRVNVTPAPESTKYSGAVTDTEVYITAQ